MVAEREEEKREGRSLRDETWPGGRGGGNQGREGQAKRFEEHKDRVGKQSIRRTHSMHLEATPSVITR